MTDLAFGRSFDSLKTGKSSRIMEEVEAPVMVFGLFHYVPWVAHFFKLVPFMVAHKAKFDQYLDSLVEERKKMADAKRDVFSWFLDAYTKEPVKTPQMQKNLIGDAMLIVIAGSGPTAPALAATLYHMALRPDLVEKLHKELRSANFAVGETTHSHLAKLKFLDALINEALRLHPPIRSGPERMTPPEGLQIGDTYVPGNIRIQTPLYSLHRGTRPKSC
jgi:cytochrome P450